MYIYELIKLNIYLIFIINNIIFIINAQYYLVHFCFRLGINKTLLKNYLLFYFSFGINKYNISSSVILLNIFPPFCFVFFISISLLILSISTSHFLMIFFIIFKSTR